MGNAERLVIGAVINGLRKSGAIDNTALDFIAEELHRALEKAKDYTTALTPIANLAQDVRDMRIR